MQAFTGREERDGGLATTALNGRQTLAALVASLSTVTHVHLRGSMLHLQRHARSGDACRAPPSVRVHHLPWLSHLWHTS